MQIRWLTAFLDFPKVNYGNGVTFWRAISGSTVSPPRGPNREFASLEPFHGDPHLKVQRVESGDGGIHLDISVDDVSLAAREAVALGATTIHDAGDEYQTFSSPGGFVFCLVKWSGESVRARPIRWPGDTISIIDQVCIDVPTAGYDDELAFWAALTGYPARPTSRPELTLLRRDRSLAIGILLQRLDYANPTVPATAHLDVASNVVDDEVARHTDWGAQVLQRFSNWTVMADPFGRPYRITNRNPRTGD